MFYLSSMLYNLRDKYFFFYKATMTRTLNNNFQGFHNQGGMKCVPVVVEVVALASVMFASSEQ